ncbi:uncharacterized protein N7518_007232 [Penicillium psychrosexuale]|uniref:uncharacterized protein n=1 Tax=Penicillium psychrosexuale TaxID=1002107 RepID=UPI0025456000|nr:uncharacterized protein N7518_007232 [Penicillium psychrosexuale]KAJ5790221.1 hypothetical protein N7518_007232 [Penicillium psychrosexuale]
MDSRMKGNVKERQEDSSPESVLVQCQSLGKQKKKWSVAKDKKEWGVGKDKKEWGVGKHKKKWTLGRPHEVCCFENESYSRSGSGSRVLNAFLCTGRISREISREDTTVLSDELGRSLDTKQIERGVFLRIGQDQG